MRIAFDITGGPWQALIGEEEVKSQNHLTAISKSFKRIYSESDPVRLY